METKVIATIGKVAAVVGCTAWQSYNLIFWLCSLLQPHYSTFGYSASVT